MISNFLPLFKYHIGDCNLFSGYYEKKKRFLGDSFFLDGNSDSEENTG